jgi:hypothetical protein
MPWAAIPFGHHTALPPAVNPTDSIIPSFNHVIPAFPIVMPGPDRASLSLLYVQKNGLVVRPLKKTSFCTLHENSIYETHLDGFRDDVKS